MNKNLLIVGAGVYGALVKEISISTKLYEKINFVDDGAEIAMDGSKVVGKISDLSTLSAKYTHIVVAIGNPKIRLSCIRHIKEKLPFHIETIISPQAYVSTSAQIGEGCIIEPMAVVHTGCKLGTGCIVSAGAIINHLSVCNDGVHVDCSATVAGNAFVPTGRKIESGEVFTGYENFVRCNCGLVEN